MEVINKESGYKRDLPMATTILVFGILAILLCWSYGIIAFILSVITLVMSSRSVRLFKSNSEQYEYSSYKRIAVGRICAIIALVISIFALLLTVLVILGLVGGVSIMALIDMFI